MIININFLPRWQKKDILWLIGLSISFLMSALMHHYCKQSQLRSQQDIHLLTQEIHTLELALTHNALTIASAPKKTLVIPSILQFLQAMPSTIPVGLYLTHISKTSTHWTLIGHSEKVDTISQWMNCLKKLSCNAALHSIQFNEKNNDFPVSFQIEVRV